MSRTLEAALRVGVCKNTLLRWISLGLIEDVGRDWRGWRVWSDQDISRAKRFRQRYVSQPIPRVRRRPQAKAEYAKAAADSMACCDRARRHRSRMAS